MVGAGSGLLMLEEDEDDDGDEEEVTGEDDFRERVAWQSKFDTKICFGCGTTFNPITNRHHHCRGCGRVVCGPCSKKKRKVKGYAKVQRICDECNKSMASPFSVETVLRVAFALCPCLRWAKRELKKQQQQSMLADGTIFVRQTLKASDAIRRAAATLSSVTSMFGKKADAPEALCDSTRVRVRLRADGLSLSVAPIASEEDDDVVYLHDVRRVEAKGAAALVVFGKDDFVLFEGAAVDKKTRDAWVNALDSAAKEAASKPPPPREKRAAGMMGGSARRATREVELQTKKRDAEKKKSEYMKGTGGGMKYTAIAMAERMTNATV